MAKEVTISLHYKIPDDEIVRMPGWDDDAWRRTILKAANEQLGGILLAMGLESTAVASVYVGDELPF